MRPHRSSLGHPPVGGPSLSRAPPLVQHRSGERQRENSSVWELSREGREGRIAWQAFFSKKRAGGIPRQHTHASLDGTARSALKQASGVTMPSSSGRRLNAHGHDMGKVRLAHLSSERMNMRFRRDFVFVRCGR